MIILQAKAEAGTSLDAACLESLEACNRLAAGIDLEFEGRIIRIRPCMKAADLLR